MCSEVRPIRAVVYGVGTMNALTTRLLLDKGVDIVGAPSRSPAKVGTDLGIVAGLGRELGVLVESDPERVLSDRTVDIAVVAVNSYMVDHFAHLETCARCGVNAITLAEEALYPWLTSPVLTAKLDRLAKQHHITLTGAGHTDTYWVGLGLSLMGAAHHVDEAIGFATWNIEDYGPEIAHDMRVGQSPETIRAALEGDGAAPSFGRNALDAIVAGLGLTAVSVSTSSEPVLAETVRHSSSLGVDIEPGLGIGITEVVEVQTAQGARFRFEMTGKIYGPGEMDSGGWSVKGEPNLQLVTPDIDGRMSTCAQLVNRIPDVINAPPGFVTIDRLPGLRYRAFPLSRYLAAQPDA